MDHQLQNSNKMAKAASSSYHVVSSNNGHAGHDQDPNMATSMTKQYQALPCTVDNDVELTINRQPDWVSFWQNKHQQQQRNMDTMTGYLLWSIMSFFHSFERRKESSRHFLQGWNRLRSSLGMVLESTMSLWFVPLSFILFYGGLQLWELMLPSTILSMTSTSMMLCHDWRTHSSSSSTTMPMPAIITLPRMEGLVLLTLAMVIVGGIGSFCSWMETEFLNNTTEQTLLPVWNLTILVPPDMARNWVQYEKRMLHQIVARMGSVE